MVESSLDRTTAPAVILDVAGKSFAFGLRWTSAAARTSLADEAETAALAEGANYVVLHGGCNQFALAHVENAAPGWRSITLRPVAGAPAIAAAAGTATLAAFPLDDGRWLVLAIDRKGILPDGDLVLAEETLARARIELLLAQSPTSWRRKFLPAEWNVAESRTVAPQNLLGQSRAPRLISLWLLIHRRRLSAGLAVLAAALAAALIQTIRLLNAPAPVAALPFPPATPVAAVWTPAALAIDRCLSAFRDAQRFRAVPGWVAGQYSCQGGEGVAVSFTRTVDGQISAMKALVPGAQLADDGRSAVLALSLSALPRISATELFAPRRQYQLVGLDLAQRLNGAFAVQVGRKPLPGETPKPGLANQAWTGFTWTYQTQAPAIVWAGAIARLGAISIDTITYSPADNLWQLSGTLYASN